MKRKYIGGVLMAVLALASLVWYGCSKEEDSSSGSILGTVTDFSTGEPVANANVSLRPGGETTLTGYDGVYEFKNIANGKYSITVSKAGYSDLIDDYEIVVSNGKTIRRDVQLIELIESFKVLASGQEKDMIDFGGDATINRIQLEIFNDGTKNISVEISKSSEWITLQPGTTLTIKPNTGESCIVEIDRKKLAVGNNTGYIYLNSDAITKQITIYALGLSAPIVSNPTLRNLQYTSVEAWSSIIDDGGGNIIDKGFQASYSTYHFDVSLGAGGGEFHSQIGYGSFQKGAIIRAYADNGVRKGYSDWVEIE